MKKHKVTRQFLNNKDGMAAIMCRVTQPPKAYHEQDDTWGDSFDANLSLSDCGRMVTLEFDAYDEKDVKARFDKIDRIRAALKNIEEGLIEYYFHTGVLSEQERKACRKAREEADVEEAQVRHRVSQLLEDIEDGLI
jgi:hypothetical protein